MQWIMIRGTLAPILRELGAELLKRDMSIQKLNRCYVIKSSGKWRCECQ